MVAFRGALSPLLLQHHCSIFGSGEGYVEEVVPVEFAPHRPVSHFRSDVSNNHGVRFYVLGLRNGPEPYLPISGAEICAQPP